MTAPRFDRFACLERARQLLDSNDDLNLRYASLELRFCLEALAYEKIQSYSQWIQPSVYKSWQPSHVVKALVKLEPHATSSIEVFIREEDEKGNPVGDMIPLGRQEPLDIDWLEKAYNAVGNFLHIPNPTLATPKPKDKKPEEIRKKLEEIMKAVEPQIKNPFHIAAAPIVPFICEKCGKGTFFNAKNMGQVEKIECLTPFCGALYVPRENAEVKEGEKGRLLFDRYALNFKCQKCEAEEILNPDKFTLGHKLKCKKCQTEHMVVRCEISRLQEENSEQK